MCTCPWVKRGTAVLRAGACCFDIPSCIAPIVCVRGIQDHQIFQDHQMRARPVLARAASDNVKDKVCCEFRILKLRLRIVTLIVIVSTSSTMTTTSTAMTAFVCHSHKVSQSEGRGERGGRERGGRGRGFVDGHKSYYRRNNKARLSPHQLKTCFVPPSLLPLLLLLLMLPPPPPPPPLLLLGVVNILHPSADVLRCFPAPNALSPAHVTPHRAGHSHG